MKIVANGRSLMRSRRGITLPEVLVAFVILLIVLYMLYSVFLSGSRDSDLTRRRLSALKCGQAELERISQAAYEELPPEKHTLHATLDETGSMCCVVRLAHSPVERSVRVRMAGSEPEGELKVDYATASVYFPSSLSGKQVTIYYTYKYARRETLRIPGHAPYQVQLGSWPTSEQVEVSDGSGKHLFPAVDEELGLLTFDARDAAKTVEVVYRALDEEGHVEGIYLSPDLGSTSTTDCGFKQLTVTERWRVDDMVKNLELTYVRAR